MLKIKYEDGLIYFNKYFSPPPPIFTTEFCRYLLKKKEINSFVKNEFDEELEEIEKIDNIKKRN